MVGAPLGGEMRNFHLSNDGWELIQNKHDKGPWELLIHLGAMRGKTGEVSDLVKFGLIGAGMDEGEAIKLLELTFKPSKLGRFMI